MLQDPSHKYHPFHPIGLVNRQWPDKVHLQPPVWMSTDLRDGNQALFEPMNAESKLKMFNTLCDIGFKEIEVAFPSASQTDYDFVRKLIEDDHIPGDVTIEVLTQARDHLIRRTMESLKGARRAIVHVYNATSKPFRDIVFGMSKQQVIDMAVNSVRLVRDLAEAQPETEWILEYSPETFTATELEFAKDICDAVVETWGATPNNKVIINLPATVEMATPNTFADQIEWMHTHLARRDSIIISVHPHNDRGTAVAAAELAMLAGAERVEGCLFGNGERTGNVDIVTLAMNLYTQGISPGLDFSDINAIARIAERCTGLPVHPRHPYAGDLVFTAFSGSHQDAIKKGFAVQEPNEKWDVPYLPVDPEDVGRSYDSVIRVNSQSGKGGIAYLLETEYGVILPRRLQIEFSADVQAYTDRHGGEVSADIIWGLFSQSYIEAQQPVRYIEHHLYEHNGAQGIRLNVEIDGITHLLAGEGNGPIDAAVHAFRSIDIDLQVRDFIEHSLSGSQDGGDARACAIVELAQVGGSQEYFGAGIDTNIVTASIKALTSAVSRIQANPQHMVSSQVSW